MWLETVRYLLGPTRLLPMVALAVPLALAQYTVSVDRPLSTAITAVLFGGFIAVGPWSWRWAHSKTGLLRWLWPVVALAPFGLAFGMTALTDAVPSVLFSTLSGALGASLYLVGSWGLGRDIELEIGLIEAERRAEALDQAARSARLLALDAHLDPHFLFNTLNAIAEWCAIDPERAEEAILDLAGVLRTIQEGVAAPMWPLERELDLARQVLALHETRDPDQIAVAITSSATDEQVPPLLLLPLIENAVTHGPARGVSGVISIEVDVETEHMAVTVRNPGAFSGPRSGGLGLQSVRDRIALAWGETAQLDIRADGATTAATVRWRRA